MAATLHRVSLVFLIVAAVGGVVLDNSHYNKNQPSPNTQSNSNQIYQLVQQQLQLGLTRFVTGEGALGCDEQVIPVSSLWVKGWYYDNYLDVNSRRQWNELGQASTMWANTDLFEALLQEARPTDNVGLNCWSYSFDAYKNWNFSTNPLYYESLDVPTWETNYDGGEYSANLSFQFNVSDPASQEWQYVNFTATSFVRVDVKPREWYTRSLPFLLRNARPSSNNGLCGTKRMNECFFKEGTGLWTAMTTGLIIVSGCTVQTTFPHGSGNTTCQPDQPYIAGHIIQRLPVRDSFCPCTQKPITPFCTAPWHTSTSFSSDKKVIN